MTKPSDATMGGSKWPKLKETNTGPHLKLFFSQKLGTNGKSV